MVFARKRDDHLASTEEFAGQGHLSILNEFTYPPGSFQCSSCAQKDSKRREVGLISGGVGCGRVPSANPIQCDRDRDLYGPFESAGPSRLSQRVTSRKKLVPCQFGAPSILPIPNYCKR